MNVLYTMEIISMNKEMIAKELIKIAKGLVSDCKHCEVCKKTDNLIFNNHPRAKYKCLCENCIHQFLDKNSSDRIMFERLIKNKTASEIIKLAKELIEAKLNPLHDYLPSETKVKNKKTGEKGNILNGYTQEGTKWTEYEVSVANGKIVQWATKDMIVI